MQAPSFKMSPKDLINIGIFLVLYFMTMAVNAAAVAGPIWIYLALVLAAPLGGIVYQLFLTRVSHAGMVFVFGVIFGAFISMIHGWQTMIFVVLFSAAAEVIIWLGQYRSRVANFWAYPVYQLWCFGPIVPIFVNARAYSQMLIENRGKTQQYAQQVVDLSHNWLFLAAIVGLVLGLSILGSWIGQRILRKHFEKAGII